MCDSGARKRTGSTASSITTGVRVLHASCSAPTTAAGSASAALVDHDPLGGRPRAGGAGARPHDHAAAEGGGTRSGHPLRLRTGCDTPAVRRGIPRGNGSSVVEPEAMSPACGTDCLVDPCSWDPLPRQDR